MAKNEAGAAGMPICGHLADLEPVTADSEDTCPDCVAIGDTWLHLRQCQNCGHVACCDSSKNKHATAHHKATGHPVIRSYEPGESWWWCYEDGIAFEIEDMGPIRDL